jgi:hypothetical protein
MQDWSDRPTGPRPQDICRAAETRAAGIRKLLKSGQLSSVKGGGGSMDDALRLAETIEQLARLGREADAAEAVEIVGMIEVLASLLSHEIDASLRPDVGGCV